MVQLTESNILFFKKSKKKIPYLIIIKTLPNHFQIQRRKKLKIQFLWFYVPKIAFQFID